MKIVNTYEETLAHYHMKLNHAQEELEDAMRSARDLNALSADGWQGSAGEAFREGLIQFWHDMEAPRGNIEEIRRILSELGTAIEEEIRLLMEEADTGNASPL